MIRYLLVDYFDRVIWSRLNEIVLSIQTNRKCFVFHKRHDIRIDCDNFGRVVCNANCNHVCTAVRVSFSVLLPFSLSLSISSQLNILSLFFFVAISSNEFLFVFSVYYCIVEHFRNQIVAVFILIFKANY